MRDGRIVESWGEGTLEDALASIGFVRGGDQRSGDARPREQKPMTPAEMDAVVDEHVRAEAQVDIDAVLATYADQIEISSLRTSPSAQHENASMPA